MGSRVISQDHGQPGCWASPRSTGCFRGPRLPSRLRPLQTFTSQNLSSALAAARLNRGHPLGAASFLPTEEGEHLPAIFATWNMLDALMFRETRLRRNVTVESRYGSSGSDPLVLGQEDYVGRLHAYQTGYLRETQLRRMISLVRAPGVRNYCEVHTGGIEHAKAHAHAQSCTCACLSTPA